MTGVFVPAQDGHRPMKSPPPAAICRWPAPPKAASLRCHAAARCTAAAEQVFEEVAQPAAALERVIQTSLKRCPHECVPDHRLDVFQHGHRHVTQRLHFVFGARREYVDGVEPEIERPAERVDGEVEGPAHLLIGVQRGVEFLLSGFLDLLCVDLVYLPERFAELGFVGDQLLRLGDLSVTLGLDQPDPLVGVFQPAPARIRNKLLLLLR